METVVTIEPTVLTLLVGSVLPILVALITKRFADSKYKALVLLLLSVVAGWLTELQQQGGTFELKSTIINILITFGTAVITHFGLLQPTHVTGSDGVVQRAAPGGIGTERKPLTEEENYNA